MRGSVKSQCEHLYRVIDAIGTSKHEAKLLSRQAGAGNWHEIGKNLGIHSYSTKDAYLDVWKQCLCHCRENFGIRDIEKVENTHVQSFLHEKIGNGVKYSTFKQYCAALEKLEVALNKYAAERGTGREYRFDFSGVRQEARESLDRGAEARAYDNPREIIRHIENEAHRIAASVQLEGGARLAEICGLGPENLRGDGVVHLDNCKGGLERDIRVSDNTYEALKNYVESHGRLDFDKDAYREDIRAACQTVGEEYHGSHGFRWNFAQEAVERYQHEGYTYEEALSKVSEDMGHHREDITKHYLRVR